MKCILLALFALFGTTTCTAMNETKIQSKLDPEFLLFGKSGKQKSNNNPNFSSFCKEILEISAALIKDKKLEAFDGNPSTNQCHFISAEVVRIYNKIQQKNDSLTPEDNKFLGLCLLLPNGFSKAEETRKQFATALFNKVELQKIFTDVSTCELAELELARLIFKKTSDFIKGFKVPKHPVLSAEKLKKELQELTKSPKNLLDKGRPCLPKYPGIYAFFALLAQEKMPLLIRIRNSMGMIKHYTVNTEGGIVDAVGEPTTEACVIFEGKGEDKDIKGHAITELLSAAAAAFMHKRQDDFEVLIGQKQKNGIFYAFPELYTSYMNALSSSKSTTFKIAHTSPGFFNPKAKKLHIDATVEKRLKCFNRGIK